MPAIPAELRFRNASRVCAPRITPTQLRATLTAELQHFFVLVLSNPKYVFFTTLFCFGAFKSKICVFFIFQICKRSLIIFPGSLMESVKMRK